MTVYNGERYLSEAIRSIQSQSLSDFEFVIVDDGSEDRTPEILREAQADSRIRVISKPRLGRARALNVAWTNACGTYIANLDADDIAYPSRLEKQLGFLRQHREIGLGESRYSSKKANGILGQKNQKPIIHYDHLYLH